MKLAMISILALLCLAGSASADVVTLKNGDRVTGTLVTIKGGNAATKIRYPRRFIHPHGQGGDLHGG